MIPHEIPYKYMTRLEPCRRFLGPLYIVLTTTLGLTFLALSNPYLESRTFWPSYVSLSTEIALTHIFGVQLTFTSTKDDFNILLASNLILPTEPPGISPSYPRLLMYKELTSLRSAIRGLHALSANRVNFMITQYCWADFERRWSMAHTKLRQTRCDKDYILNAAVYLEAVLRNINFVAWIASSPGQFDSYIGNPIAQTPGGMTWVKTLYDHEWLDEIDEESLWKSFGLSTFQLAYSNQYQIGIEEKITIENALGQVSIVTIKSLPATKRGALWTSSYLYLGFHYDFVAVAANQSLIRNTTNFFGDIDETQIEVYDAGWPLPPFYQAIHDQIGPLGTIDLIFIAPPNDLVGIVQKYRAIIFPILAESTTLQDNLKSFGTFELFPTPKKWQHSNYIFYGGNMMCEFPTTTSFVQNTYGFDDSCSGTSILSVDMDVLNGWFALTMLEGDAVSPCDLTIPIEKTQCIQAMSQLQLMLPLSTLSFKYSLSKGTHDILSSLAIMQSFDNGSTIILDQQYLLEKSWAFMGWLKIYDWVLNQREVVSFQGDLSSMNLISYRYAPIASQTLSTFATGWTQYLRLCVYACSTVLTFVATLCLALFIWYGCPQGTHWFVFNRIVSTAWLNRGLMGLRSIVAMLCLATSPILPMSLTHGYTLLSLENRAWWVSGILAGETTWITYIVHELLHPVCSSYTRRFAPYSSLAAWIIICVLDITSPVQIQGQIRRECLSSNMDEMVFCSSGSLVVGSYQRAIWIGTINITSVLICFALGYKHSSSNKNGVPNLLLPPALIDFYLQNQPALTQHLCVDKVTAAMCGVFLVPWRDGNFLFDTKLWLTLRPSTLHFQNDATTIALPQCLSHQPPMWYSPAPIIKPVRRWRRPIIALGFCYLGLSLAGNIAYLNVASTNLDNDYGWASYNITGMRAFLANAFNKKLLVSHKTTINLNDAAQGDITVMYNDTKTPIIWGETIARQQLYDSRLITLKDVVIGLRNMNPCLLPWMFTQYCWLDFNQEWSMASTERRQKRCSKRFFNGALYLEGALRNMRSWSEFDYCWGFSFDIAFESYLKSTVSGQSWLKRTTENTISVDDEVSYWLSKGITSFTLQWQNYKTIGLSDSISIVTALGLTYPLRLSHSSSQMHIKQQSSLKMYWSFASDLWAVASNTTSIAGYSLILSSSKFAYTNHSSESLLFENTTLTLPLTPGFEATRHVLGPFNSVDMLHVPAPEPLLRLNEFYQESLATLLLEDLEAQAAYSAITPPSLILGIPQELYQNTTAIIVGGNILCGNDVPNLSPTGGMSTFFGVKNTCHAYFSDYIVPKVGEILFSLLALQAQSPLNMDDITTICSIDALALPSCPSKYSMILEFGLGNKLALPQKLLDATQSKIDELNVQVVQFLSSSTSSSVDMYLKKVISTRDRVYTFYGWCMLYELASGLREIVTFEGDAGSVTAISTRNDPLKMSTLDDTIPQSLSYLFQFCAQYVTSVLIGVATLTIVYAVLHRGNIEGLNLFELNRIVGHVWIGRTFLIFRSITAMWLLNTNTLELVQVGIATRCSSPPLAWYNSILAAGESTWLVYVLNDILSCMTLQYTSYYATKSAVLVWFCVAWWALASPQQIYSFIERKCSFVNMDEALICSSGYVQIGSVIRLCGVVGVCLGSIFLCYVLERLRLPNLPRLNIPTQLLNSQSYYLLDFTHWVQGDKYFLDSTSALLAGIVTLQSHDHLHVLDVKSWRYFSVAVSELDQMLSSNGQHQRMNGTIPLSYI